MHLCLFPSTGSITTRDKIRGLVRPNKEVRGNVRERETISWSRRSDVSSRCTSSLNHLQLQVAPQLEYREPKVEKKKNRFVCVFYAVSTTACTHAVFSQ
jgi:hypothetical protein